LGRLRLRGLGLHDLQLDGIARGVHGGDHQKHCVRDGRQRRGRGRRLDQQEAVFPGDEEVLRAFLDDPAPGDDLDQGKGRVGFLRRIPQQRGIKMRIGFVGDESYVGLLVNDDFGNASLAFQGRFDGGPAGPSEGSAGARRRLFHLGARHGADKNQECDCQNESRLGSHPIAPFLRGKFSRPDRSEYTPLSGSLEPRLVMRSAAPVLSEIEGKHRLLFEHAGDKQILLPLCGIRMTSATFCIYCEAEIRPVYRRLSGPPIQLRAAITCRNFSFTEG